MQQWDKKQQKKLMFQLVNQKLYEIMCDANSSMDVLTALPPACHGKAQCEHTTGITFYQAGRPISISQTEHCAHSCGPPVPERRERARGCHG